LLLFNVDVVVESNQLINDATGHRIIVDSTCTGLPLLASVGAIILAITHCYPLYQRLMILSLALIVLACENVVRISFLFWLLSQLATPKLFDLFHLYIWQLINFLFGLMIIYIVLKYTNNKQKLNSDVVA
jgi:exosortase/archaeosortase family protein